MTESTNLGPLTTTYSPPTECSVPHVYVRDDDRGFVGDWGHSCRAAGTVGDTRINLVFESCYPGSLGTYINSGKGEYLTTRPVYSLGLVCPSGFQTTCSLTRREGEGTPSTEGLLTTASNAIWGRLEN